MGLGSFWDPNEHPRGWHGRFAKKWKISDALRGILDHFTPRTFQSDSQAGQYAFNQGHKNGPFSSVELTRLRKDWDEAQDHIRAGDMDPQSKAFDDMMQSHMRPTAEGLIATTTFGPDALGLRPDQLHDGPGGITDLFGTVLGNKGYQAVHLGTDVQAGQHGPGKISATILVPPGTKVAFPGQSAQDRGFFLDKEQPLLITRVDPDGMGGWRIAAVAEPHPGTGSSQVSQDLNPGRKGVGLTPEERAARLAQPSTMPAPATPPSAPATEATIPPTSVQAPAVGRTTQQEAARVQRAQAGRQANVNEGNPPVQAPLPTPNPREAPPAPAAPAAAPATPTGVPARNEPIHAPSIGATGTEGKSASEIANTPPPAPEAPPVLSPAEQGASLKDAYMASGIQSPSAGSRRGLFNRAYLNAKRTSGHPEQALRDLETDIAHAQQGLDSGQDTTPHLAEDIKSMNDLADLISTHFGIPRAKKEQPAPTSPVQRTGAPDTFLEAPKAPGARAAKKVSGQPSKSTTGLTPAEQGGAGPGTAGVGGPRTRTEKNAAKVAGRAAAGEQKPTVSAARVQAGDVVLARKNDKGEWEHTSTKTGATPITVTSKKPGSGGTHVIEGTDPNGNKVTLNPIRGQNVLHRHQEKAPRALAAKKAAKATAPTAPKSAAAKAMESQAAKEAADATGIRKMARDSGITGDGGGLVTDAEHELSRGTSPQEVASRLDKQAQKLSEDAVKEHTLKEGDSLDVASNKRAMVREANDNADKLRELADRIRGKSPEQAPAPAKTVVGPNPQAVSAARKAYDDIVARRGPNGDRKVSLQDIRQELQQNHNFSRSEVDKALRELGRGESAHGGLISGTTKPSRREAAGAMKMGGEDVHFLQLPRPGEAARGAETTPHAPEVPVPTAPAAEAKSLDKMTKAELLAHPDATGAKQSWTKAKIKDHILANGSKTPEAPAAPTPLPPVALNLDDPRLGTDRLSRDIIQGISQHGDTPEEQVQHLIADGMHPDQAQSYVDEVVALMKHRGLMPAVGKAAPSNPTETAKLLGRKAARPSVPIDNGPRANEFTKAWDAAGIPEAPGSAGRSIKEIRKDLAEGKIDPAEGVRRMESEVSFNKDELSQVEADLRAPDLTDKQRAKLQAEHAKISEGIKAQEKASEFLRGHFGGKGDAPTVAEVKAELPADSGRWIDKATPEDMQEAAKIQGLKEPQGATAEEMFDDLIKQTIENELDKRKGAKAEQAAKAEAARVKKEAREAGKAEFRPGGEKHLDAAKIAEGIDGLDPRMVDRAQADLNDGQTPGQVARGLRAQAGAHETIHSLAPEDRADRQEELDQRKAVADRMRELADRIEASKRPRKPRAPSTKLTPTDRTVAKETAKATGTPVAEVRSAIEDSKKADAKLQDLGIPTTADELHARMAERVSEPFNEATTRAEAEKAAHDVRTSLTLAEIRAMAAPHGITGKSKDDILKKLVARRFPGPRTESIGQAGLERARASQAAAKEGGRLTGGQFDQLKAGDPIDVHLGGSKTRRDTVTKVEPNGTLHTKGGYKYGPGSDVQVSKAGEAAPAAPPVDRAARLAAAKAGAKKAGPAAEPMLSPEAEKARRAQEVADNLARLDAARAVKKAAPAKAVPAKKAAPVRTAAPSTVPGPPVKSAPSSATPGGHIADRVRPAAVTDTPIKLPNGGSDQGRVHLDGQTGSLWLDLYHDDRVKNSDLNEIARIGEGIGTGHVDIEKDAIPALEKLKAKAPDTAVAERIQKAIDKLSAPHVAVPDIPGAPPEVMQYLRDLEKIPTARQIPRGGDKSVLDRKIDLIRRIASGDQERGLDDKLSSHVLHESVDGAFQMWKLDDKLSPINPGGKVIRQWMRDLRSGGGPKAEGGPAAIRVPTALPAESVRKRAVRAILSRTKTGRAALDRIEGGHREREGALRLVRSTPVRPSLSMAHGSREVSDVLAREAKHITGRELPVNLDGLHEDVARGFAEGILQGLEAHPHADLRRVSWATAATFPDAEDGGQWTGFADPADQSIVFRATETWHQILHHFTDRGTNERGIRSAVARTPAAVGLHEFGHILTFGPHREQLIHDANDVSLAHYKAYGLRSSATLQEFISRSISSYAWKDITEMLAEAYADVGTHGRHASPLSQDLYRLILAHNPRR